MSRPPKQSHTPYLTSPERPTPKRTGRGFVCRRLKPNGKVCGKVCANLQGYKSHLRSPKNHAAAIDSPAATTQQQDDQVPHYTDGPTDPLPLLLLEVMPYAELLELNYRVAKILHRRLPAEMAGRGRVGNHGSESVCTSPTPATAEANQRQQLGTDSEEQFVNDVLNGQFVLLP